jgi:hypothetical protein
VSDEEGRSGQSASRLAWPGYRTFLGFIVSVFLVEFLVRTASHRYLNIDDEVVFQWKAAWVAESSPHDVVILGDSTAHQGLSPGAMKRAGVPSALNVASPSGSGVVAEEYARRAGWKARHVIYAAHPLMVFDTPLQNHERHLWPLLEPYLWPPLTADLILARVWRTFGRRLALSSGLSRLVRDRSLQARERFDYRWWKATQDDDGFLRTDSQSTDVARREVEARAYARSIITDAVLERTTRFRARTLVHAIASWLVPGGEATLIVMPQPKVTRDALAERAPHAALMARWLEIGESSNAAVLDCHAALRDEELLDHTHPTVAGGERLSVGIAGWIARREVPAGCVRLR